MGIFAFIDGHYRHANSADIASYGILVRQNTIILFSHAGIIEGHQLTQDMAEWAALVGLFEWYKDNLGNAIVLSDSQTLINKISGFWIGKDSSFVPYWHKVYENITHRRDKPDLQFQWIPRKMNEAHKLAAGALQLFVGKCEIVNLLSN